MKDDAVQEQGRGVDLHGSTQETVEDPNVPGMRGQSGCYLGSLFKITHYLTPTRGLKGTLKQKDCSQLDASHG